MFDSSLNSILFYLCPVSFSDNTFNLGFFHFCVPIFSTISCKSEKHISSYFILRHFPSNDFN